MKLARLVLPPCFAAHKNNPTFFWCDKWVTLFHGFCCNYTLYPFFVKNFSPRLSEGPRFFLMGNSFFRGFAAVGLRRRISNFLPSSWKSPGRRPQALAGFKCRSILNRMACGVGLAFDIGGRARPPTPLKASKRAPLLRVVDMFKNRKCRQKMALGGVGLGQGADCRKS